MKAVAVAAAKYFKTSGRHFPWRGERDLYRLAVAEILLQKTRAETMAARYDEFVTQYPNLVALSRASAADLEERLKPLGLSRKRAQHLLGLADAGVKYGPRVFEKWETSLATLPGIGAYAARAIAVFGLGQPLGIVDANVARILRRLFRIRSSDPRAVAFQRYADEIAALAPDPRATNFGLLDIGAAICKQRPICADCPLEAFCPRYGVSRT